MLTGQDILCISSIDWDFIWQGHQEIMDNLARQGNRVLFVENTGVRTLRLRDIPRLKHRFLNWWRSTKGFRQEEENLFVYSPLILPFPYSRLARWINRALLLRALQRWMRVTGFRQPIVWTYLPTQLVIDLIDRIDPILVIYYCIADFEELTPQPRKISKSERRLLDRTDLVFVQGKVLCQRLKPHPNIHIFPFGVNMKTFGRHISPAPELQSLKPPIVGYVGGIHSHVDLDLIEQIALEIDGTVVLLGPVQTDVSHLRKLDNIVFVESQPHSRIPQFVRNFDVGIIPYRLTGYTKTVYPTKLNEYLATGIPVVSTNLPEIERYNLEHGQVVTVARDGEAFIKAILDGIERNSPVEIERRVQAARRNSWEPRIIEMSDAIEKILASRLQVKERWEESLRRLYRVARRRIAWVTLGPVAACLLVILIFYTPFVWLIAKPLMVVESPRSVDAIVVFAGGVGESGKAGGGYLERVKQAVILYRGGNASRLIFSSGYVFSFQEAYVMKELAVSQGVPTSAIFLETKAANTYENIALVRKILDKQGWKEILLVSSPYHMRRALLTWRKVAPEITVVPTPVPQSQFYSHSWGASLEQVRGILHEYVAILAYWWRGQI